MKNDDLIQQIEAEQGWLAGLGVEVQPPPGLSDRLKQVVQVALDEAWLAKQGVEVPPPGNLEALKEAVAGELGDRAESGSAVQGLQQVGPVRQIGRTVRLFGALSAAAVLLLAVGLYDWSPRDVEPVVEAEIDFEYFATVLSAEQSDYESEWREIEQELDDLESTLVSSTLTLWDTAFSDELDTLADDFQDIYDQFDRGAG